MSKIDDTLNKIMISRYGKDVRQSIHDGIEQCYEDSHTVEVSENEPTDEYTNVWIDNSNRSKEPTIIPEVKDDIMSYQDTWSSMKISKEIQNQSVFSNEQLGVRFFPGYIMTSGAFGGVSEDRKITEYIYCRENVTVKYCGEYNPYDVVLAIAFYDENKKFIKGEKQKVSGEIETVISPVGTAYVVLGYFPTALDYWYLSIEDATIVKKIEEIKGNIQILKSDKLDKKYGKNLFDKSNIEDGSYYLDYNGTVIKNEYVDNYYTSKPIYVKPETTYTISLANMGAARPYCEYDKNGNYVAEGTSTEDEMTPITFTTSDRTSFIRICGFKTSIEKQQLEIGNKKTEFEEYTENYDVWKNSQEIEEIKSHLDMDTGVDLDVILPNTIYCLKDTSLPIYFENILMKGLNDSGDIRFTDGKRTSRLQKLTFGETGNKSINCSVIKNLERVKEKSFKLIVSEKSVNSGKSINLLCIGDSFTDMGLYISELKRLMEEDGCEINLIGTCGTYSCKHEGLSGGTIQNTFLDNTAGVGRIVTVTGVTTAPDTTYPGRTYRDQNNNDWSIRGSKINPDGNGKIVVTKYQASESDFSNFPSSGTLTKTSVGNGDETISYRDPISAYYNPFINGDTGKLDIKWYLSTWGFESPDIVILQFTYNDIPEWSDEEYLKTVTNNFIEAVEEIHSNLQNAKIIVSIEPYGAINSNYDWFGKKRSVLQWTQMMLDTFETDLYRDFVFIAPSYACVDLLFGYSKSEITPSERYSNITEQDSGDGIHPDTGMLQIADCLYPIVTYINSFR